MTGCSERLTCVDLLGSADYVACVGTYTYLPVASPRDEQNKETPTVKTTAVKERGGDIIITRPPGSESSFLVTSSRHDRDHAITSPAARPANDTLTPGYPAAHNSMANWWSDEEDSNVAPRQLNRLRRVTEVEASRFSHAGAPAALASLPAAATSSSARGASDRSSHARSVAASQYRQSAPRARSSSSQQPAIEYLDGCLPDPSRRHAAKRAQDVFELSSDDDSDRDTGRINKLFCSHARTIASAPVVAARASAGASRAASSSSARSSAPSEYRSSVARAADPPSKPRPAAEYVIDLSRDSSNEKPAAEEAMPAEEKKRTEHLFENLAAGDSQASYWLPGARTTAKPEQAARKRRHEQDDVIELSSGSSDEESVDFADKKPAAKPGKSDFADKKPAAKPGKSEGDEEDDDEEEDDDLADGDLLLNREDYGDYDPARPPADDPTFDTEEDYVEHYEALHGGAVLSFGGTRRAGLNAAQKEQLGRFLAGGRRLYDILREANCVFLPCGRYDGCFDQDNMNNGNSFVYSVKQKSKKKSTKRRKTAAATTAATAAKMRVKVGSCYHGGRRLSAYEKTSNVTSENVVPMINMNAIPIPVQRGLIASLLNTMEPHAPDMPRTKRDVAAIDKGGLPVFTALMCRGMVKTSEECRHLGGLKRVNGLMIRSILNNTESAVQVALGDDERLEVDPWTREALFDG
ncbi:hypothetical protein THAOC_32121 [Thalassiosira oceanica]|uniref:Uncharacterized protein n=1 Tax=Thalassiosira oceanica TaxID=159749 RepID=K0R7U3_THAOC|nr:hypothetical protein THAOC_32121 [Thalassiosira oceanica]|eukprot:EJK49040.1 hypothetical protein THAOC_32121 [Thalassiosira oceanica]